MGALRGRLLSIPPNCLQANRENRELSAKDVRQSTSRSLPQRKGPEFPQQ